VKTNPKILVASYHFPPDAAVGALRPARFVRTLREFGWQPYVLTVKDERRERLDPGRMQGLDGVPVIKANEPPKLETVYFRVRGGIRKRLHQQDFESGRTTIWGTHPIAAKETLAQKAKRHYISLVQYQPDDHKGWALRAAFKAIWTIRRHRIDFLLTSGPPASCHFVGLLAKRATGVKWAADFRDPWIEVAEVRSPHYRSRAGDALERRLERLVVRDADLVVTTNDSLRDSMRARYGSLPAERFVSVQNSIDTDRFTLLDTVEKYPRLTITYAGTLYSGRTPEPLFQAVGELLASGAATASDIRIKLVGECRHIDGVETAAVARKYGLDEVVELVDPVPYAEALRIMQMSHLLLIVAPDRHRLCVPAKLYDYLGSGTRVFALTGEGATADLIRETGSGVCFAEPDVTGVRDYLLGLIRDKTYQGLRNRSELFEAYHSRSVTRQLSDRLLSLVT